MAETKKAEEKGNLVEKHFQEKAEKSKENIRNGGEAVTISLVNKVNVRFTKDFGAFIKKGHTQEVSETAYEIYNKENVVEKL